ncbi:MULTISPECIES: protein translocase subunit SecF [unclassified Helicobacter]|uniref:protein translocase subunit SecF n=1 Tax=unclassified Helicobacter TaxID=2593540 RepID=UPI000DCB64D5|nr:MULTISPECIES: protein translocase subunit SecF [unclassified Helicobacter]MDY4426714.1 protein translocase subunit SecF [Helicobacter sp.]RAX53434.1 protein translocase subunit SecF [Helicobacter sp. 11-8110]
MDFFKHNKIYDFVKMSNYGIVLSLILFIGSLVLFIKPGFTLGVDFAGGTIIQIQYSKEAPLAEIRQRLESVEEFQGAQVSEFGSPEEILIRLATATSSVNQDIGEEVTNLLKDTGDFQIRRVDIVGPKVGDELREKGILALSFAIISIMAYVAYRYEWRFALASILALIHDIVIAAGAVILFDVDLSLEVIAALLTLIGYSINDTIIIFDRIRETIGIRASNNLKAVVNEALSATLSRTMLTSLTVFFVVLTLYLFGGEIIKGFSLPMLVGSIVGSYSSIFVASKLVMILGFDLGKYHKKLVDQERKALEKKKMREMYERGRV